MSTLIGEQEVQLKALGSVLAEMCPVTGPLTEAEITFFYRTSFFVRRGAYVVTIKSAEEFVKDQGRFVIDSLILL